MSTPPEHDRVPTEPVPAGAELATLRVDGTVVARYSDGAALPPALAPRPFLHPVTTLSGRVVTDAQPADHRWHLGVGVAVQDVAGVNIWGGRTYLPGQGYTWREDHGRQQHVAWESRDDGGFAERLSWLGPDGRHLLSERRVVRAVRATERAWVMGFAFDLHNDTEAPLHLGSPATNGRAGAGYGGFFWRLPHLSAARVFTAEAEGEDAVHGALAPWVAVSGTGDSAVTVALAAADEHTAQDPWFVRLADYPGIGSQLAAATPVQLRPGQVVRRAFRVLVADDVLDADGIGAALGD